VASSALSLHFTSEEMGTTPKDFLQIEQGLERLGLSHEEAEGRLGTFMTKVRDLGSRKFVSELGRDLQQLGEGGSQLAERLAAIYKATGNTKETVIEAARVMANATPAQRLYLSQKLGLPERIAYLTDAMRNNVDVVVLSYEEAQKYHNSWVTLRVSLENIGTTLGGTIITKLNELYETLKAKGVFDAFNKWLQDFNADHFIEQIDKVLGHAGTLVKGIQRARGHLERYRGMRWGFHWDTFMRNMDRFNRPGPGPEDFLGVGVTAKKYGAMTDEEIRQLKADNNRILEDIKEDLSPDASPGQQGAYPPGQARRGILDRGTGRYDLGGGKFDPGGVYKGGGGGERLVLKGGETIIPPIRAGTGTVISVVGDSRGGGHRVHRGTDYGGRGSRGADIVATTDGQVVTEAGVIGSMYGWGVKTIDKYGREHVYAHMIPGSPKVRVGATLQQGQTIGSVGNSGNAATTDPHVHYEVRPYKGGYNQSLNPLPAIRESAPKVEGNKSSTTAPPSSSVPTPGPDPQPPTATPQSDVGKAIDRSIAQILMGPVQGSIRFNVLAPPGTKVETSASGIFENNATVDRTMRRDPLGTEAGN
jgi:murein DD-endopeptidase MepM/ murein hydrolase activator NlpD